MTRPTAARDRPAARPTKEVVIGHGRRFCLIGERINPTGRRIFQEQLRAGDLSAIERDVKAQVEGGADVLDVNMGVPLTDEAELLAKAITMVQELTDLPICIDSSVVEALEAGLSVYKGRALVNSITAEDDRMAAILPLVKKYDAAIIALPNDARRDPDGGGEADPADPEDHRRGDHRVRHRPGRHRDRPARDADRRRHHHLAGHPRHDAPDQGALRRQHDLRRVQRLVRHARPAHPRRGVPADGDDRRPDQRDHGHPHAADRRRGQGGRPGARPRRVGHGTGSRRTAPGPRQPPGRERHRAGSRRGARGLLTRDVPPGRPDRATGGRAERPRRHRPGRPGVHPARPGWSGDRPALRARAARRQRLRRGVVERRSDRLHLWRPRHLSQVQGAGGSPQRRRGGDHPARRAHLHRRRDRQGLATGLPGAGDGRPRRHRPGADHAAQGGDRRRGPPGDPAAGDPEALRRARRALARRTSRPTSTGCSRRWTTSSSPPTCTPCAGCRPCCDRRTSR